MLADFAGPHGIALKTEKHEALFDLGTITFCIREAKSLPIRGERILKHKLRKILRHQAIISVYCERKMRVRKTIRENPIMLRKEKTYHTQSILMHTHNNKNKSIK